MRYFILIALSCAFLMGCQSTPQDRQKDIAWHTARFEKCIDWCESLGTPHAIDESRGGCACLSGAAF